MASRHRSQQRSVSGAYPRARRNQSQGRGRMLNFERSELDANMRTSRNRTLFLAQQSFNEEHQRLEEDTACSRILMPRNTTVLQHMKSLAGDVPISSIISSSISTTRHIARDETRARVFAGLKDRTVVNRLNGRAYRVYGVCWSMTPESTYETDDWGISHRTFEDYLFQTYKTFVKEIDQPILVVRDQGDSGSLLLVPELCGLNC